MSEERAAFPATFSDFKLVRSRKVVQLVFEVPLEKSKQALECLGGMPNPAEEVWCGIARLKEEPEKKQDKPQYTIGQYIAMRCREVEFRLFLASFAPAEWQPLKDERDAGDFLKWKYEVNSRNDITEEQWRSLMSDYRAFEQRRAVTA